MKRFIFPIAVFLGFFLIEKVSLLPSVKILTQPDATYLYFDYKTELLDQVAEIHKRNQKPENFISGERKKTVLILGSSRLLYFDTARFHRNYPDWELFNFSAPVTAPAYYAYILERVLDRGVIPNYIVVEADPLQYNDGSDHFLRSNLAYSFDLPFVIGHQNLFSHHEISFFLGRYLFASYKYPPDPANFSARFKDSKNRWLLALQELDKFQRENRGAGRSIIPRENWYERDFGRFEVGARGTIGWLYGNYKISERQFDFLTLLLSTAQKNKIPTLILRPQVSRTMQRQLDSDPKLGPQLALWEKTFSEKTKPYGASFLDLRKHPDISCNTFVDAGHMSLDCYHMLTVAMMQEYWSIQN